jgi:hypothetical protein
MMEVCKWVRRLLDEGLLRGFEPRRLEIYVG